MTRVISPLKTHYPISALGEHINEFTLTLISPLSANKH
jgi:hypothetical protein